LDVRNRELKLLRQQHHQTKIGYCRVKVFDFKRKELFHLQVNEILWDGEGKWVVSLGMEQPATLHSTWTLWVFQKGQTNRKNDAKETSLDDYESTLKKSFDFKTIQVRNNQHDAPSSHSVFVVTQDFWKCFNNLPDYNTLNTDTCFHFMRGDVEPKW
jgi:hypothetical protein